MDFENLDADSCYRAVTARDARFDLAPLRRAHIRLQARSTTRRMVNEMIDRPVPPHGRMPLFARLDALSARYRALGGDPADLVRGG